MARPIDTGRLKPIHDRFIDEYLTDFNAARAYRQAGFKAGTPNAAAIGAYKLLQRPHVQKALQVRLAYAKKKLDVTFDRALEEMARLAFADFRKAFDAGGAMLAPDKMDDATAAAVSNIDMAARPGQGAVTIRMKMHDKVQPLKTLLEILKPRPDLPHSGASVTIDAAAVAKMTDEDIAKGLANIDKLLEKLAGKQAT